ncbi:MAG: SMC-Scp complex subunit ScpB [Parcubacteria group bacterium]
MLNIEAQIESILLFKNEPVSVSELSKWLSVSEEEVRQAVANLQNFYKDRGVVVLTLNDMISFGTHPDASSLIERLQKDELSRNLGRAGLETLAIILYKGPVSRREVDHIRGVNSSFIIRTLLIRGLVERDEDGVGRGYNYKPTLKLMQYLGVTKPEDLPEYGPVFKKVEEFMNAEPEEKDE